MRKTLALVGLSAFSLSTLGAASAATSPVVAQSTCKVGSSVAILSLDAKGAGALAMTHEDASYSCHLRLADVQGPPFSENATRMLTVELSRAGCDTPSVKRRVQRTIDLHIAVPKAGATDSMALIERRGGVYQCVIDVLDLDALGELRKNLTPS